MTKEKWFDAETAPALLDLCKRCEARGVAFLSICENRPVETIRTMALVPRFSAIMATVEAAMRAQGNVDALIVGLMTHAREHGHASVCLEQFGVPPGLPASRVRA